MKKKILVTGVAGLIGQQTAELLLSEGHQVVGLDNLNHYYDIRLKEHRLSLLKGKPGFTFVRVDLENQEALRLVFEAHEFEAVINLAARAGVRYSMENPYVYLNTNVNGTLHLLELMKTHKVQKLVLASTSSLYAGLPMPFTENVDVSTPISPYAASKKAAEMLAYTYHHLYGLDVSILRYFTVYGPMGRPDMSYFRFIQWIDKGQPITLYGDGSQARDFTYVTDIASGTVKALRPLGYQVINLGGGNNPVSINYLIEKIEGFLGKKATINHQPFHKADMLSTWADISKAKQLLDWQPQVPFAEGIRRCVEYYQSNKEWLKDVAI